jgi:hypothetical protein
VLEATVVADVEVDIGEGQIRHLRREAATLVESVPRPSDPCEVRFYPSDHAVVNTNRYFADHEDGDFASLGYAYLTDACGNIVYGVGESDSELHTEPGDEFRVVGPTEPPPEAAGVWAVARSYPQSWYFPLTLRGRDPDSSTQIPDGF